MSGSDSLLQEMVTESLLCGHLAGSGKIGMDDAETDPGPMKSEFEEARREVDVTG